MTTISHVDQLLELDGTAFVESSYKAVLGRSLDTQGKYYYLARLQTDLGKEQLLVELGTSAEGKARNAQLPGLNDLIAAHAIIEGRRKKRLSWLAGFFSPRRDLDWHLTRLAHQIAKIAQQLARQQQPMPVPPANHQVAPAAPAAQPTPPPPPAPDLSGLGPHARKLALAVLRDKQLPEKRSY